MVQEMVITHESYLNLSKHDFYLVGIEELNSVHVELIEFPSFLPMLLMVV